MIYFNQKKSSRFRKNFTLKIDFESQNLPTFDNFYSTDSKAKKTF